MEWLAYLLEANFYLLAFYAFYRLFLADSTLYSKNRYYLLGTSFLAFIMPILQLGFLKPTHINENLDLINQKVAKLEHINPTVISPMTDTFQIKDYIYPLYIIIACIFAIKLIIGITKIIHLSITAKRKRSGSFILVELSDEKTAFSFFNLLFIHPKLAEVDTIISHEIIHIKQKHSLDILFFELIHIISWFNPILYLLKKDVKLLHEYIADEIITANNMQKHEYAMFLIQHSFGVIPTPLTNQIFNQSILKRRIKMLNKQKTTGWTRFRMLLTLPLIALMLGMSTMAFTKDYGLIDLLPEKSKPLIPVQEKLKSTEKAKKMAPKKDVVWFPPPIMKSYDGTYAYIPNYRKDKNTGKYIPAEVLHIVVNGKAITDYSVFFGASNATKIQYIKPDLAIKKYGEIAQKGAIEITGANVKRLTTPAPVAPPPPKNKNNVKFPPPIVKRDKNYFIPIRSVNEAGENVYDDRRYIVINDKKLTEVETFYGITGATKIVTLDAAEAIKKYGSEANYGAVEITGANIRYVRSAADGPPPPIKTVVKFPPPVVKKN